MNVSKVNSTSDIPQNPTISYLLLLSCRNISDQKRHSVDMPDALLSRDNGAKRSDERWSLSNKRSYNNTPGILLVSLYNDSLEGLEMETSVNSKDEN